MPPRTESTNIFIRILERHGIPSVMLAITLYALQMLYVDNRALSDRVVSAFIQQSETTQKMANSIDALTAEIRARK